MGGIEEDHIIQETGSRQFQWVFGEVKNNVLDHEYDSDFVEEYSNDSSVSIVSSSETADDATSSSSSSSPLSFHDGPLFELSELMAHLPLKRGLSKYYHGKSESFGSLANFKNIEDIAKKGSQRSRGSKCRSFGGDKSQSQTLNPKGTIVKNKKSGLSISRSLVTSLGGMSSIFHF